MVERAVTKSGKDKDGDIISLCKYGEYWSPRRKQDVISDIENNIHSYYVPWSDGTTTPIKVVQGPTGKYLRTDKDHTKRNNLDDLLDC